MQEIHRGLVWTVSAVELSDGSCPFHADFEHRLNQRQRDDLSALLTLFADRKVWNNRTKFKKIDDPIWAFKKFQVRVPCYMQPNYRIVLTHLFLKKGDEWPQREIERARRLMKEAI